MGSKSKPSQTTGRRRLIPLAAAAAVLLPLPVATGVALQGPGTSSAWIWALGAAATVTIVLVVVILVRRSRRALEEAWRRHGAGGRHPAGGWMARFVYSTIGYLYFKDTSRKRDSR